MVSVLSTLVAIMVTAVLISVLASLADRLSLVDHPEGHKRHKTPTPLVGGLGMFCGFVFGLLTLDEPLYFLRSLFLGAGLMLVIGVLDDMHELSSGNRFLFQILAAMGMVFLGNVVLLDLGYLYGDEIVQMGRWSVLLTLFAAVGVINAINMFDGIDGQAGSTAFIVTAGLMSCCVVGGVMTEAKVLGLLLGAIGTFLWFNFPLPFRERATTFMGDAGSMFLGFTLVWFMVKLSQGEGAVIKPITCVWLLGVPLADTVSVMLRRLAKGKLPFRADRSHIHHILQQRGLSSQKSLAVVLVLVLFTTALGLAGELWNVNDQSMLFAYLVFFVMFFVASTVTYTESSTTVN